MVDSRLHELPPPEVGGTVATRPLLLKKLSIASDVAGPMLRAWDFLYVTSQVRNVQASSVRRLPSKESVTFLRLAICFFVGSSLPVDNTSVQMLPETLVLFCCFCVVLSCVVLLGFVSSIFFVGACFFVFLCLDFLLSCVVSRPL